MPNQSFIEIAFSEESLDSVGASVKKDLEEDLKIKGIKKVRYSEVYYLEETKTEKLKEIAEKLFVDPVIQTYSINQDLIKGYDFLIEVKYHENVTDNLGATATESIADYTSENIKVRSAKKYYFFGKDKRKAEKIAVGLLCNPLIENYRIKTTQKNSGEKK